MAKIMNIAEFQKAGYLQEVNRQFLHPLGLALQIKIDPVTREKELRAILDQREDPAGIHFDPEILSVDKMERISEEMDIRAQERLDQFGYVIQPVGE